MCSTILIVEDEFIIANALRVTLQQAGHKVTGIASSTEEAHEHLLAAKPDLVLLDIRLNGEQTGIDLARKLKAENIGFIYLSANSSQKVLELAKVTEPYGFLVKPFRDKDLLVALDIALYRHKNSLESRLRQETILQKALLDISNETSEPEQKLLKIGRAIRSFVPFDLVVFGNKSLEKERFDDFGYLRTGFDEYQFVGENELQLDSGFNPKTTSEAIGNNNAEVRAGIYNNETHKTDTAGTLRRKIGVHRFEIASYIVFPISLSDGSQIRYFFGSRQHDFYNQGHLAVLNLFTSCLTNVTEKMLLSGPASIFTTPYPGGKKQTGTENDHASRNLPVFKNIVGSHPLILAVLDLVMQVAPYNTSVLIMGESGTGKERVAHSLHLLSPRKAGPYIKVNCAAIPATLIESELFGHEKGAFTGAVEKRKGKFEQADGGTIFLDEVGELPLDMQVRLLRVLQEKEIDPVGGTRPRKVDIRIVAATNRNLEREVADGKSGSTFITD
ncbi:sigma 54-interacting transcriptional regulator [Dyadobacter sp. CY261]|uniref:sigma 54-interacting transcriptional regulator n=1 Tax=Dyadobacter sp. CY261 TaxID=2907203 RepID=UPI002714D826|nr:sigma 54-interacting transcriptional regulator [Dyadobacter sp. CY261]